MHRPEAFTRRQKLKTAAAWLVVGVLGAQSSLAFAQTASPPATAAPPAAAEPSSSHVFNYGQDHPSCLAWTDDCRTCSAAGCSNIGTACQPGPIRCTKEKDTDKK